MATVAHLPEKLEDQSVKRQKLGETEPPERTYCPICDLITYHSIENCPHRERAIGRYCLLCTGPCTQKEEGEHGYKIVVMMKRCGYCLRPGLHWSRDCPTEKKDEMEPESTGELSDESF